jgi:mevalonate kinase
MKGSAFGKVILLGEHAVVYGVPAIVLGIDRGATARVMPSRSPSAGSIDRPVSHGGCSELLLRADGGAQALSIKSDGASDLARAFAALLGACGVTSPVHVEVETDLPAAAGLGCSAALGVAIVRALDASLDRPTAPPNETIGRAMAWEKVFHGNPSGVDATAAARGGCLLYERTHGGVHLQDLKVGAPVHLAVGHSGIPSTTRAMVEHVAKLRERKPDLVAQSFGGIRSLVGNARLALEANDHVGLGRLMDLNQMLLSGLMLSTEEIEEMCRLAREAGALGAKLTGSGGGGCVIALAEKDPELILARWEKAGFRSFATRVLPGNRADSERSEAE